MAADLARFSLWPHQRLFFHSASKSTASLLDSRPGFLPKRHRPQSLARKQDQRRFGRCLGHRLAVSNSLGAEPLAQNTVLRHERRDESSVLFDVSGMMCGACVSRVKSILSSDDRVDSVVVNMLTETAAIRLKSGEVSAEADSAVHVAESLARRLTDCGFPTKSRNAEVGVAENVRKWKEMVEKKRRLLVKSRNRVAVAWTLAALCCGSHASHILHSLGIHIHGPSMDILHNSYAKGCFAVVALLGPGRELLFDGLRAFRKGSPNMNSLVGFGAVAAFIISAASLLNPELDWDASFFDEPVMLLGFVLLGRSLEERARVKASSDMNELLDFEAHLTDFGIAKSLCTSKTYTPTYIMGTIGYIDPEYARTSRLTEKSDVYSFGIVLLELLTGRKAVDDESNLHQLILSKTANNAVMETVDPEITATCKDLGAVKKAIQLALLCTKRQPSDRPTMHEVTSVVGSLLPSSTPLKPTPTITSMPPSAKVSSYKDEYTNLKTPHLLNCPSMSTSDAQLFLKFGEVISQNSE